MTTKKRILFIGIAGFSVSAILAMLPMGKDQASALGYACGLNQGKYMAEEHRVWDDDGDQDRTARVKAKQNHVPVELIDLFVHRYAEGFTAGQEQGKPKHYLIHYHFDGVDRDEEDLATAQSPDEAVQELREYLWTTRSMRGSDLGSISVSKVLELTEEQYEERTK